MVMLRGWLVDTFLVLAYVAEVEALKCYYLPLQGFYGLQTVQIILDFMGLSLRLKD